MRNFKSYMLIIFTFLIIILSGYNILTLANKYNSKNILDTYIRSIVNKKTLKNRYDYYFFFITSPMDCSSCTQFLTTKIFIENIKSVMKVLKKRIQINFLVYGNLKEEEKIEFVKDIRCCVNIFLEGRDKVDNFLNNYFKTSHTPIIIILDKNFVIKYWRNFLVKSNDYEIVYIEFLNSLGGIL